MKVCLLALAAFVAIAATTTPRPEFDKAKLMGSPTAPIMMEVYSSFACPHCKDFHEHVLPSIIHDYVTPGKLAIIPRECFPSSQYMALEAANMATAAARIGKYREAADALFIQQDLWIATGTPWSAVASVLKPEEQKRVQALAKDAGVMAEVQRDLKRATEVHIERTPTLIVIGRDGKEYPIAGVPNYQIFKSLVDSLLAGK
jgi:protein-disulfide isomerase